MDVIEYGDLLKKVRKANQRIQRIQSRYGESSWAVNQLYERIDNDNIRGISALTGNIRVDKNMSDIQLKAIKKATEIFLDPKKTQTSTLRGITKAINNMQDALKKHYSDFDPENPKILTDRDAEKLYNIVEIKDLRNTVEQIGASETWTRVLRAKEQNLSKKQFINLFKNVDVNINDKDIKADLERIYNMYMS